MRRLISLAMISQLPSLRGDPMIASMFFKVNSSLSGCALPALRLMKLNATAPLVTVSLLSAVGSQVSGSAVATDLLYHIFTVASWPKRFKF
jgi:hypothetical protein